MWEQCAIVVTCRGRKPRPTTKLAVQLTPTAMLVANGRADELNNSDTKNHGMDPGPTANAMTKAMTSTTAKPDTMELTFCLNKTKNDQLIGIIDNGIVYYYTHSVVRREL